MTPDEPAQQKSDAHLAQEAGTNLPAAPDPGPDVVRTRHGMFGVTGSGDTSGYGGLVAPVALPGATPRPWGGWFDGAAEVLTELLGEDGGPGWDAAVEKVVVSHGQLVLHVRREHVLAVCRALRDDQDLRFEMCMGVSGVHYPDETGRELHAVYQLLSITHNRRVTLEVSVPDGDARVPSVTSVYPAVDWHEREVWDFFGVVFDGHPALARIQMPDDWPGHPQRKDYPLGGIPVEYKGATIAPPDIRRQYS